MAWVACTENLLADDGFGGTVAALNVFEHQDDRWVIVAHHGSPVARKIGVTARTHGPTRADLTRAGGLAHAA